MICVQPAYQEHAKGEEHPLPNMKARLGATVGAAALAAGLVVTGSTPASAAGAQDVFTFTPLIPDGKSGTISVTNETKNRGAGSAGWYSYGDKLEARDLLADGYGIEAHLSTGRVATTDGHASPYTATKTGNLPEGNSYQMWVCVFGHGYKTCSNKVWVKS